MLHPAPHIAQIHPVTSPHNQKPIKNASRYKPSKNTMLIFSMGTRRAGNNSVEQASNTWGAVFPETRVQDGTMKRKRHLAEVM
jgi:hypothetical protein